MTNELQKASMHICIAEEFCCERHRVFNNLASNIVTLLVSVLTVYLKYHKQIKINKK